MARRATYFFDARASTPSLFLISGAWEFMRPQGTLASTSVLRSHIRAYSFMQYDIGFVSKEEKDILAQKGMQRPSWQQSHDEAPVTFLTTKTGDKVAFVRFPSLPPGEDTPNTQLITHIEQSIKSVTPQVQLVVGISDWGWLGENEYLRNNSRYVPDVLLGSGRGSGLNGRLLAEDRCIWVRPYDKGRSLCKVQIFEWPTRKNSFAWSVSKNYNTSSIGLNDTYADNPDVAAFFE
ncbi:hypothetical protein GO013_07135 [Pseudodesulfovibrio sp. JC047]|uniref:UshA-like (seleno)protein family 2 n=1 Tax=Pseudodesulfovibrio sp. JC047 TaxID=2683199 RepID=UPI001406995F|nr:hypothetical protein [Pseudodesulfovibrio sp. JC047]NDV19192.1 hypothetical protein [Pseudodesulfovibrio sp. JC047]